jgi:voltage-gated potassium channel Kch
VARERLGRLSHYPAEADRTTVGYGDIRPETAGGKVIAVAVTLVGIGFLTIIIGAIAQRFLVTVLADDHLTVEEELAFNEVGGEELAPERYDHP